MVLTDTGLAKVFQRIKSFVLAQLNSKASAIHTHTVSDVSDFPANYVTTDTTQTIDGTKTFNSQIKGTIDKSKDYYLSDNTLASTNGSLGTVKYYPVTSTADLDTAIFEHSLWAAQKVFNSIPGALDSFYYIDQYFYLQRTATSNRIQILRGYRNANLQMVRVYNSQTNSWSEWKKFANDSDVVHNSGDEIVGGNKDFSGTTNIQSLTINGVAAGDILIHNANEFALVSDLSTVATSGSYNDLSNKPATMTPTSHTHGNITNDGKIGSNANKPLITTTDGTVTTGSFGTSANTFCEGNDSRLSDARTPTAHTHSASDITSGLATVATSGSYNDLSNKPTIPTVNNATLTIQQNGTTVDTFTANSSDDKTVNIQCVDLTSNQTIDGNKTFSNGLFASKNGQGDLATLEDSSINSTNEDANGMPLTGHTNSVKIKGSQFNVVPCMLTGQLYTGGDTSAELRAYKYKDLTTNAMIAIRYVYANNSGFVQFKNISFIIPNVTSTTNLGSASLQWNTTYTRNILIDNDINIWGSVINKTSNSGSLSLRGGTNYADGASIGLYGKDYNSTIAGVATITAYGNSDYTIFYLYPNGTMSVYNNSTDTTKHLALQEDVDTLLNNKANSSHTHTTSDITDFPTIPTKTSDLTNDSGFLTSHQDLSGYVPRSGGSVLTGLSLSKTDDTSFFELNGGSEWHHGASISLRGKDCNTYGDNGCFLVKASDGTNEKLLAGNPNGTLTWNGQSIQTTSDQRLKQQITQIDNALLDAWEDVNLVQFKYNDAVDQKGKDKARLHTGYVVQQIDSACKSHGVDISTYGLYCHEEYPQETEEVEVEQADGTKVKEKKVIREASEHYSLRYTEVYAVECMYLRRENSRLKEKLASLEERLEKLEKAEK